MNRHASMNRVFRLVWNESLEAYVPAAETTRGRGKSSKRKLMAAVLSLSSTIAQAGPTGGQVIGGSAAITQSGSTTTIQQSTQNLSLNWQTFNVAPKETVDFLQPNASAIAVNRILDPNGSVILGHLNANGQVYLINPNGVIFGKGAQVNVGGLVASTLDLNDLTANNAAKTFSGTGTGSVVNDGTLTAAPGCSIALIGNHVSNSGAVYAQLGTVALGAGSAATLTFQGSHLVSMQVDQSVLNSSAANGGLMRADGGRVMMTAGAQNALLASVVNNTGVIEARTLENHDGTITLLGGMRAGTVNVAGTLDASAPNGGNGGFIETSAAHVEVVDSTKVSTLASSGLTGTWLIDPTDFTISAGTTAQSASGIGATTLQTELSGGNVAIVTSAGGTQNGDINVNAPFSWSANALTLTAANNINVNAVMTVGGTARVDFEPGSGTLLMGFAADGSFAGRVDISSSATNPLTIGGQVYAVVNTLGVPGDAVSAPATATLQGMAASANLGGYFALGGNIDAGATAAWNACSTCNNGAAGHYGFMPIGNAGTPFLGVFDGLGHTISNLTVNQYAGGQVGLFGQIGGFGQIAPFPTIRNVGLLGGAVTAGSAGGGSVGSISYAGSLVGINYGVVRNSFSTAAVGGFTANNFPYLTVGGLVGANYGLVSNSHATGNVYNNETSYGGTGGLVGSNSYQGAIDRSYATGNVTGIDGSFELGGLVGTSNVSSISNSYATGNVSAGANSSYLGGLAGGSSTIVNSYATGNVSGGDGSYRLGGLVGAGGASITNSFATGTVTVNGTTGGGGNADLGGLIGASYGAVSNSYATGNIIVTGANMGPVGGLVGMLVGGSVTNSYATGSLASAGVGGGLIGQISNGGTTSGSFWNTTTSGSTTSAGGLGLTTAQIQSQSNFTSATPANGSVNPGWDFGATWVMYEGHTAPLLQVFMTPLTVIGTVTQTYDGAVFAPAIAGLSYSLVPDFSHLFGTVTVSGTAAGAEHVGTYTFTPGGLYSDQLGYLIGYSSGSLTITPATLTVAGTTATKVYNGTTAAPLTGGSLVGLFGSDAVTLTQAGTFASKNVGTGIAVTADDSLGGAAAADYTLVEPTALTGTITPAPLTVNGTTVANKIANGSNAAALANGTLVGVVSGDSVSLNQSGLFASTSAGIGIAVTATDSLSGASAADYSLVEPTGLTGTILPASTGAGAPGALVLAAENARTQIVENFIYPRLWASPQGVNASPTIAVLGAAEGAGDGANLQQAIAVNVSMKIGATGTLKIENGGLHLPSNLVVGNE